MHRFALEEKHIREENLRLQRKLQQEVERREALCRHLSESESSLEMEEERQFNEALSVRYFFFVSWIRLLSISNLRPPAPLLPDAGDGKAKLSYCFSLANRHSN